jgi:Flp pilus assembly protein TadB
VSAMTVLAAAIAALVAVQASKIVFLILVGVCGIAFGTWLRLHLENRKKNKK